MHVSNFWPFTALRAWWERNVTDRIEQLEARAKALSNQAGYLEERLQAAIDFETTADRLSRLEDNFTAASELIDRLGKTNSEMSEAVSRVEQENRNLNEILDRYEERDKQIDPNAKCPACGHRGGKLKTIRDVKTKEVRCFNTCDRCGNRFISSDLVKGAEFCATYYQDELPAEQIGQRQYYQAEVIEGNDGKAKK